MWIVFFYFFYYLFIYLFYAVGSSLFLLSVCFLFMFSILSQRCPLLATSCPSFFCLLSMLISDSRFDLVWFRLSCDHGWIRSGSVNVRKQQQQQQLYIIMSYFVLHFVFRRELYFDPLKQATASIRITIQRCKICIMVATNHFTERHRLTSQQSEASVCCSWMQ